MTEKQRPSHTAFSVKDSPGGNGKWTEIGAAWRTKDEHGLILHLDCLPRDGRVILQPSERKRA